ncbi:MAG: hypothetical protein ABL995_01245 [Bryobacteraceae bacterium]
MQRVTVRTSTIFIGKGKETHVFHSVDDVPPALRHELEQSTNSFNSATILIADRRGREEIVRALNGLPSSLRSRLANSLNSRAQEPEPVVPEGVVDRSVGFVRRNWLEITLPVAVGFIIWAAFNYR